MKKFCFIFFFIFLCFSLFSAEPVLTKIGTYKCGKQPKQVLFSPDDKYIIMPLLDEDGFDIFDMASKKILKRINPPDSEKLGFAEGLFIPEKSCFFVSQMTTAQIHQYTYPDFNYVRSISTDANWSKFMVWNSEKQIIAVSNWVSNDISIIDFDTGTVLRKIDTAAAPRGLFFMNEGKELISLAYDGGKIEKFETDTGKRLNSISVSKSAMRHIVVNNTKTKAYVSDMFFRKVYEIDLDKFEITRETRVFNNPNTIDLLNDEYLFVSSRGPNNPEDYTKRSPKNGKITIIDTSTMIPLYEIEGGNQPTGLDVSNNGKYLCFSNFQDANIELYEIDTSTPLTRDIKELSYFTIMGEIELRQNPDFSEPVKDMTLNHEGGMKVCVLEKGKQDYHNARHGIWLKVITTAPMWVESGDWIEKNTRYWIFLEDERQIFDYVE